MVPVYDGIKFINDFFKPLKDVETNFEAIFVDNGSSDGSFEVLSEKCSEFRNFKVLKYTEKKSSYAARNFGVKNCSGEILFFTDIDCILSKEYLALLNNEKIKLEKNIITGPVDIFFQKKNLYEIFDKCAYLKQEEYVSLGYAVTANLIVSKKIFNEVGMFPEFTSGADNKFCKSCKKFGSDIIFKNELKVFHPARASKLEHQTKAKRLGYGQAEFFFYDEPSFLKIIFFLSKHLLLIIFPFNTLRLFFKVILHEEFKRKNFFSTFIFIYNIGYLQRLEMLKYLFTVYLKS